MKSLFDLLPQLDSIQKSRCNSERADIIRQFTEEINKERFPYKKFKEISPRVVAVKLGHLKDNATLYFFLSQCKDYKSRHGSFSRCFFGALKVQ